MAGMGSDGNKRDGGMALKCDRLTTSDAPAGRSWLRKMITVLAGHLPALVKSSLNDPDAAA